MDVPLAGGESGDGEGGISPTTLPSSPINVKVRLSHLIGEEGGSLPHHRPWTPSLGPRPGNARCAATNGGSCVTCDLLTEGTRFKSMMSGKEYLFMPSVDCQVLTCFNLVCAMQQSCGVTGIFDGNPRYPLNTVIF